MKLHNELVSFGYQHFKHLFFYSLFIFIIALSLGTGTTWEHNYFTT